MKRYRAESAAPGRSRGRWRQDDAYRKCRPAAGSGSGEKTVGLIENDSWAPMAAKVMKGMLEGCKELTILEPAVKITSALSPESEAQLEALADALMA